MSGSGGNGVGAGKLGDGRTGLLVLNMVVAFVLEVALFFAFATWALLSFPQAPVAAVLVTVAVLAVLWGMFMSPKARFRVRWPGHPMVVGVLAGVGAVALAAVGLIGWAVGLAALGVVKIVLAYAVGRAGDGSQWA
ncbi:hypothetical protein GCM10023081_20380 [Arthrobacter ginkgonis]|uniref:DUF2568 domain-containing protein n=1 Tax=Arthrobacter ginkgonis TaxID=1630594 RepID=A0ABP7C787_9MICC